MRRPGVTLTEVLVAVFICGMGLMAIMTLFPTGASKMAQALEDDRCGHCARNAAAIFRANWRSALQNQYWVNPASKTTAPTAALDPALIGFTNDLRTGPIYFDPIGFVAFGGPGLPGGIIRRNLFNGMSYQQALQWCSMADDIDFAPNATPLDRTGVGGVTRQGRYSWAWMVRPLVNASGGPLERSTGFLPVQMRELDYSVVVYHNRPISQNAFGVANGELQYPGVTFVPPNQILLNTKPAIRKRGWILIAQDVPFGGGATKRGQFYQVINIQQSGAQTLLTVQVNSRVQGFPIGGGTIVCMNNVAQVFDRSTLE